MTRLLFALLFVAALTGCALPALPPQVHLPATGCSGVLTSPTTIVTPAHCVLSDDVAFRLPTGVEGMTAVVHRNTHTDYAELVLARRALYPWYAEYRKPDVGQAAMFWGNCRHRAAYLFDAVYVGEHETPFAPQGIDPGMWPHWATMHGAVTCYGDSGGGAWAAGPEGDTWVYYGMLSQFWAQQVRFGAPNDQPVDIHMPYGGLLLTAEGER